MGRVPRLGTAIGSPGIGGEGRVGGESGARTDINGAAVVKSVEVRLEVEDEWEGSLCNDGLLEQELAGEVGTEDLSPTFSLANGRSIDTMSS